jgi:prepilin-type N-terminal cleavage/methylation domain-containing protein
MMTTNRGFTLLEVVVSLAIAGLLLGLVAAMVVPSTSDSELATRVLAARDSAIRSGTIVAITVDSVRMTFHPDGSASPARITDGSATWHLDPWTGELTRAPR